MRLGTGTELGSFLASVLAPSASTAPKYGFSIDATAYGEIDPDSYDHKSRLNSTEESILTSCSTLFEPASPRRSTTQRATHRPPDLQLILR
jgi:hypothetical protein